MKLNSDVNLDANTKEILNPAYTKVTFIAQILIRIIDIIAGLVRLLSFDTFMYICND